MWLFVLAGCGLLSGYGLFRGAASVRRSHAPAGRRLSVIIPARNESRSLPHLLETLRSQTFLPEEVIVADDGSTDDTGRIAESYGARVLRIDNLPPGWTGKNWAVWNGYQEASGDLLAFIDADIRLAPDALASLASERERSGGVISVVPYHEAERWHEKLALILNVLGLFAFASPYERKNARQGLYGSFILCTREDYEKAGGHSSVRAEVLDDLNLGEKFKSAGIRITNLVGRGAVSFRMYPHGLGSLIEGFAKGAVLSTSKLRAATVFLTALWIVGLLVSELAPLYLLSDPSQLVPIMTIYVLYTAQLFYIARFAGAFKWFVPAVHVLSTALFLYIMLNSLCQVAFRRQVRWKGRRIDVGSRRRL